MRRSLQDLPLVGRPDTGGVVGGGAGLVQPGQLPEPVRQRPEQEGPRLLAHPPQPGVLERGQVPGALGSGRDQRLDGVPLRGRRPPATHDGAADGVHHRHADQVTVGGEHRGQVGAAAAVPCVHELLVQAADGRLLGGPPGGVLAHVGAPFETEPDARGGCARVLMRRPLRAPVGARTAEPPRGDRSGHGACLYLHVDPVQGPRRTEGLGQVFGTDHDGHRYLRSRMRPAPCVCVRAARPASSRSPRVACTWTVGRMCRVGITRWWEPGWDPAGP
jgi:hypothetical protein